MKIRRISVRRIKHATYNPRHDLQPGDAMYDRLEQSIKTFGYVEPIVWNRRTGNLVGGHQRFKILLSQGYKKVTASVVDLSPAQEKALNIALNRIQGGWDEVKLAQLLQEIMCEPEFDVELTGFDLPEAQNLIAEALPVGPESEENEETPDFARPAVTQKDELLILGKHRLLCGDCTVEKDVRRLMCGRKAFLFATDPPYLVNYDGMNHPGRHRGGRSKNKNWSKTYGVTWDDAKAILLAKDDRDGSLYVIEADIARRSTDATIERIVQYASMHHIREFAVEANQFQELLANQLESRLRRGGYTVPIRRRTNTSNKKTRIETLEPFISQGQIRFSRHHTALLEQLWRFPMAAHDDGPDALEMAVELALRRRFLARIVPLRGF